MGIGDVKDWCRSGEERPGRTAHDGGGGTIESVRQTFQAELEALEAQLQREGELVIRSLRAALHALRREELDLADEVIAFDDEIDEVYLGIEEEIHSLLARQTPVATDLRLVLAVLHNNVHLERMGDYCVTVAKLTKLAHGLDADPGLIEGFDEMGARAEEMIRVALDAFRGRDLERAESLVDLDELIDRTNRRVVQHVLDLGGDPARREWGLRMLLVSRCLERIGDHAVDIGERTAYLVTGEFREFTDASHQAAAPAS
jgi:phosphate transport system protein